MTPSDRDRIGEVLKAEAQNVAAAKTRRHLPIRRIVRGSGGGLVEASIIIDRERLRAESYAERDAIDLAAALQGLTDEQAEALNAVVATERAHAAREAMSCLPSPARICATWSAFGVSFIAGLVLGEGHLAALPMSVLAGALFWFGQSQPKQQLWTTTAAPPPPQ